MRKITPLRGHSSPSGESEVVTPLAPRYQIIVDLLSEGPRTICELAIACGYEKGALGGRNYVSVVLGRLARRGYVFHNYNPIASHRGAYYVLMARPHGDVIESAGNEVRCEACGLRLARDHREDLYCSPCQRSRLDVELEMLAPPTLWDAMVAS